MQPVFSQRRRALSLRLPGQPCRSPRYDSVSPTVISHRVVSSCRCGRTNQGCLLCGPDKHLTIQKWQGARKRRCEVTLGNPFPQNEEKGCKCRHGADEGRVGRLSSPRTHERPTSLFRTAAGTSRRALPAHGPGCTGAAAAGWLRARGPSFA